MLEIIYNQDIYFTSISAFMIDFPYMDYAGAKYGGIFDHFEKIAFENAKTFRVK